VFPSFANSKAEMMTCGVLPIDTMRDYIGPIGLILSRIDKEVLEAQFKIELPPRDSNLYTVSTFLSVFASKHGWFSGRNLPNEFLAAKAILKFYTNGNLLFCETRPDFDAEKHGKVKQCGFNVDLTAKAFVNAQNYEEIKEESDSEASTEEIMTTMNSELKKEETKAEVDNFDKQFFQGDSGKIKLNKGEKRALKFALKRGLDINQVGDLRQYLAQEIKRQTSRGAIGAEGMKGPPKPGMAHGPSN